MTKLSKIKEKITIIAIFIFLFVTSFSTTLYGQISSNKPSIKPINYAKQDRVTREILANNKNFLYKILNAQGGTAPQYQINFKDNNFHPTQAINYREVMKAYGQLSPKQLEILNTNRFILVPLPHQFKEIDISNDKTTNNINTVTTYDQILDDFIGSFNQITGMVDEYNRQPENAKFIGPDIILHVLNMYISKSLIILEQDYIFYYLEMMISGLTNNLIDLLSTAIANNDESEYNYTKKLLMQLVIPYILLHNYVPLNPEEPNKPEPANADSFDNAIILLTQLKNYFTPEELDLLAKELKLIYDALENHTSFLGLKAPDSNKPISYRQFMPRGHYIYSSKARAYYRTMVWFGLGWDLTDIDDISLLYILYSAFESSKPGINTDLINKYNENLTKLGVAATFYPKTPYEIWTTIMDLTAIFSGYPDSLSINELFKFNEILVNDEFYKSKSWTTQELQNRLKVITKDLTPTNPAFKLLQQTSVPNPIMSIFPHRYSFAWLITDRLSSKPTINELLPHCFSSLWLANILGINYNKNIMLAQLEQMHGQSLNTLNDVLSAILRNISNIIYLLQQTTTQDWYSSISSAFFSLMYSLNFTFGQGYPYYMQTPAFQAKQLETILGSYTESRYDLLLYEQVMQLFAEYGAEEFEEIPKLVKGFVEPNIAFWDGALTLVAYIENVYKYYNIFPNQLEENGFLPNLRRKLTIFRELSLKELAGVPLTEVEYEYIRRLHFNVDLSLSPAFVYNVPLEQFLSSKVVDIMGFDDLSFNENYTCGKGSLYEAIGAPSLMLVLVGNENTNRIVAGIAYNHYEFISDLPQVITDCDWKTAAYQDFEFRPGRTACLTKTDLMQALPRKNFWYQSIR